METVPIPPDWHTPMSDPIPLLGREAERAALDSAAADALSGGGGLVLLTGEAGVGKTHLAEAFLQHGELLPLRSRARNNMAAPARLAVTATRATRVADACCH